MAYLPTTHDALTAYQLAVEYHLLKAASEINMPTIDNVEETAPGKFRIQGQTSSWPAAGFCDYDAQTDTWSINLLDGTIVRIRNTPDGLAVLDEK